MSGSLTQTDTNWGIANLGVLRVIQTAKVILSPLEPSLAIEAVMDTFHRREKEHGSTTHCKCAAQERCLRAQL
jgi:hypothetical protein